MKQFIRRKLRERQRTTRIEITNYFGAGDPIRYVLEKPYLPDGCECCKAFKSSFFETRIMHLIPYYEEGEPVLFLCSDCYLEAEAHWANPPINK